MPIKFVDPKLTGDAMKDATVHMWEYFRGEKDATFDGYNW